MKRLVEDDILAWKDRADRKPMVLMGARQVGKTWLMRDFGRKHFARVHEFNFDDTPDLASVFEGTKDPASILARLAAISGARIDIGRDVIIFDEIQECGNALNSLKYFCEKCPQLAILAARSLLGVKMRRKRGSSHELPQTYPVGKVELLNVEPVSFSEFLRARNEPLWEYFMSVRGVEPIPDVFHRKLTDEYRLYLMVGGMPEVVANYIANEDPARVVKLQEDLVALYENDIVKYNGELDAAKILVVLRSVVPQLAKENSKFIYGALREGARGRGYEEAIEWLVSAKMVRRIHNVGEIAYPLAAYEVRNAFKLYLNDVGMLRSVAGVSTESLALDRDFPFKGRFVENFVLQQLAGQVEGAVHYYAERADREIDFVLQHDSVAVPVEVKAGESKKAASFKTFVNARHPRYAIRFSERNLKQDGAFVNIPLYLVSRFWNCLPRPVLASRT